MAINIFQGGSKARTGSPAAASASTRAQNAKSVLVGSSEASDSGNTAVKSSGTLGKVGNFIGKAAGMASKFLPGVGGLIAKGVSNVFNDPEWWQSVPGEAVTLNNPLRLIVRDDGNTDDVAAYKLGTAKIAIAEVLSTDQIDDDEVTRDHWATKTVRGPRARIMLPTVTAANQYLLPQIRKVVNAIPLQTATTYIDVLAVNASIYAFWRQLKKMDYMVKHGQTYLPSTDDPMFPMLRVENAPTFTALIARCEEYLRANVRLPHTLCEYLAWRYGRVYKSTNSAKAGLMCYNVLSFSHPVERYVSYLNSAMSYIALDVARQKANADLYNVYYDHDYMVEIRDDTQFVYDLKEFCLRTNLDVIDGDRLNTAYDNPNPVYIDSSLDNPTTFMASTLSTLGREGQTETSPISVLFPAGTFSFFLAGWENDTDGYQMVRWAKTVSVDGKVTETYPTAGSTVTAWNSMDSFTAPPHSRWSRFLLQSDYVPNVTVDRDGNRILTALMCCKAMDVYNKDITLKALIPGLGAEGIALDLTSLSMDSGDVPDNIIANEHLFAFANLVHIDRKTSMSYAKAEKLIARDTANLVDKLDVATAATAPAPATTAKA